MMYLLIDLGGTEIKYALMTKEAVILEKSKIRTPIGTDRNIDDLLEALDVIISQYLPEIKGIGISMPGIIDSDTGYSFTSGAILYITGKNLPQILEKKYSIPVTAENDGKAAALAELWKGSLIGVQNAAVVILGTGVGGGIIIDGKLYKGTQFSAGEMSFMLANPFKEEYWGSTGGVGCLMDLVSQKTGTPVEELDGIQIFEFANQGDTFVLDALDCYTKGIAKQLYSIQALLDLEIFAIGGGISEQPLLIKYLQKNIDEFMDNHAFKTLMPVIPTPKVITCKFFNDSNLIGALYHHLKLVNHK